MEEFDTTIRVFLNEEEAVFFGERLREGGILCEVKRRGYQSTDYLWTNIAGREILVNVRRQDAEAAQTLLQTLAEDAPMEDEGMLGGMTDAELWEVIVKREEWNETDVVMAKRMLAKRGKPVPEAELEQARKAHVSAKYSPRKVGWYWLVLGYTGWVFAIFSMFAGFWCWTLCVLIGVSLMTAKRMGPDGKRMYVFDAYSRTHGKWILILSAGTMALVLLYYAWEWSR